MTSDAERDAPVLTCERCGESWRRRGEARPRRCPRCGSSLWNVPAGRYACTRFGHGWTSRTSGAPRICPRCKSVRWDAPPKRNPGRFPAIASRYVREESLEVRVLSMHGRGMGPARIAMETGEPAERIIRILLLHGEGTGPGTERKDKIG